MSFAAGQPLERSAMISQFDGILRFVTSFTFAEFVLANLAEELLSTEGSWATK